MKRYLEVKQVRAYTFSNLVGNVGGYMGLFLGYAILNFSSLVFDAFDKIKKMTSKG